MSSGHHPIGFDQLSRAEELAMAQWPAIDQDAELGEISERFGAVGPEDRLAMVRGLMCLMLPPKSYGGSRRYEAGYLRFLALVWISAPDMVEERSEEAFADLLGVDRTTFLKQVHAMAALLAGQRPAAPAAGPSQQTLRRGSARPRRAVMRVERSG